MIESSTLTFMRVGMFQLSANAAFDANLHDFAHARGKTSP